MYHMRTQKLPPVAVSPSTSDSSLIKQISKTHCTIQLLFSSCIESSCSNMQLMLVVTFKWPYTSRGGRCA